MKKELLEKAENHVGLQKLIDSKEWQMDTCGELINTAIDILIHDVGMTEGDAYEYLELQ